MHADPLERFSVVSFVWGPGQNTPVHDHGVWGLVGVLRGIEVSTAYAIDTDGCIRAEEQQRLLPGNVTAVSPRIGDLHRVSNGAAGTSVSIHVYGGNIGAIRRRIFEPATGAAKPFVSGTPTPPSPICGTGRSRHACRFRAPRSRCCNTAGISVIKDGRHNQTDAGWFTMIPTNLEVDVLRTLVLATDLGGFVRAADRVGRSQSAVSLQMKKLEEQIGQDLFKKADA